MISKSKNNSIFIFLNFISRPDIVLLLRVAWDIALGLAFVLGIALSFFGGIRGPIFGFASIIVGAWTLIAGIRARRLERRCNA